MAKSITGAQITDLSQLQVGDFGSYPRDKFQFHWHGHERFDHNLRETVTQFIPKDLFDQWAKRLGRQIINKEYIICHVDTDRYDWETNKPDPRVLALYIHDSNFGIIEITGVK